MQLVKQLALDGACSGTAQCVQAARAELDHLLGRLSGYRRCPWWYSLGVWLRPDGAQQSRLFTRLSKRVPPKNRNNWRDFPESPYRRLVADVIITNGRYTLVYSVFCADGTRWYLDEHLFRQAVIKWNN